MVAQFDGGMITSDAGGLLLREVNETFAVIRQSGLKGTELENAQSGTIRTKLLKAGARVRVTFRRVRLSFSESYPLQRLFRHVLWNLQRLRPLRLQI